MALAILRPAAEGNYTDWSLGAGASKTAAVDYNGASLPDDDATTYISTVNSANKLNSFTLLGSSIPPIGTVTTVKARKRALQQDGGGGFEQNYGFARRAGTDSFDTGNAVSAFDVWTTLLGSAIARPGGGSWQGADITTSLEVGIRILSNVPAQSCLLTSLTFELDFEPPPGGFAFLVGQFLGPLAAVGLHELPKLIAAFNRAARGRYLIRYEEAVKVYRDLLRARHPAFSF